MVRSILLDLCLPLNNNYNAVTKPTVGVDWFARVIRVHTGERIKLKLWDTAGTEQMFGALTDK